MKMAIRIILQTLRVALALVILLFSLVTLIGGSYLQTIVLWLLVVLILYWPKVFRENWTRSTSSAARLSCIAILFILGFMVLKSGPKTSIYTSEELKNDLMHLYDNHASEWPVGTEDIWIDTKYGKVHILACGNPENPPLVMIHAASMGAHSWLENLPPLLDHFRIYSIDNIGEGNKSELTDPLIYPENQADIAEHFAYIMDVLGVERSPVFGASNGGFIALSYVSHYPERVDKLALFGPMGLTQLTGKSIMMLSIASMYPFQFIRDRVIRWALGEDTYVNDHYGDWFNCIIEATIPSVAMPVPMTTEQKVIMELPVLLFLGTRDPIVGDADIARQTANEFSNIRIEILDSGHLVAVEQKEIVNLTVQEFLGIQMD